ncbi:hypothetical protein [Williamsoniiplasma lucivorax]|uniref:DUF5673 domain-containing protein n=1 Tax=Williamsoniiplasma lucivorax TaxID=209274 RepID=A0A2S5RCZ7_9MOLU|nr:hypothetical protein [Williamsoniiplasma lucivorax]PPE05178.1 hypothetical protein ELUCI_v1c07140 [Williamsoniiplasma lucivorax]
MFSITISTVVLTTMIFLITCFFVVKTTKDILKMKQFEKQDVTFFWNQKMWICHCGIIISLVSLFVIMIIVFVIQIVGLMSNHIGDWVIGVLAVILILFSIWIITFERKIISGIIFVYKNNNLVFLDAIIPVTALIKLENDLKRRWIIILWKDQETLGNVEKIKIRYNYKIKDLLKELKIPNQFDEGE